jgi:two-component system, cell cycle sensor histidine kinase and response regulator CckA
MHQGDDDFGKAGELRQRAEALFQAKYADALGDPGAMTPHGVRRLIHQLQVHQVELEVQNEELRRAQAELGEARARYFDLYNLAPLGYCTVDQEGLVLEANLTLANLLGSVRGSLVRQPLTRFILAMDQDLYYLHRKRILEAGAQKACELRMVRKDGTFFWAHLDFGADDESESRVVISDISERKRLEGERRQLELQLQQSQNMESLGRLAGGVAHDMNNVLAAILGLASVNLELHPEGSSAHRAFDLISKAAVRGGNTVKSLLAFAHQSPSEEREIDLNEILREEVRLLERTTLSRFRLEMDLAPDLRPILGDASALAHALMNLCINAGDAMPESGTIHLSSRNVGEHWVEVVVRDTGGGMAKEVLEKALDPFFTTKGVGKGTGLGLSMVYSTIEAHRGHLTLHSEPGQGTRVEMLFPVSKSQVPLPESVHGSRTEQPHATLEVLVVDDDELVYPSIQAILETLGHRVTSAMSGEEAMAQLETGFRPDVVILDINMPGLGGAGTLPRLRVLCPEVPVLIATGRTDQAVLDLLKAHPGTALLTKPFTMGELRRHLEPLLVR